MLGAAAGLGDLGALSSVVRLGRWKDADSLVLLQECAARMRQGGFEIANVDATVVVEAPRLAAHVAAMAAALAGALSVDASLVSVKAKTSDGMGYTGDGTGVAAYAVACLESA